jgi:peptidoglycan hydrolase FlgJ
MSVNALANQLAMAPGGTGGLQTLAQTSAKAAEEKQKLRETFESVVGETFFGQTLRAMRKSVQKSAYFHGGRGEEVFQQQLDQILAEKMSKTSADKLAGPMFELFTLRRN